VKSSSDGVDSGNGRQLKLLEDGSWDMGLGHPDRVATGLRIEAAQIKLSPKADPVLKIPDACLLVEPV
jgi:hypothetical protein